MSADENMQRVAKHLQLTAVRTAVEERDAFARSAYNRYYYGIFLRIREMLKQMNPDWSSLAHAAYPQVLSGQVERTFKSELKKARKRNDSELVQSIEQAGRSIAELCKILTKANLARVVADYEPEKTVEFENADRFSLNMVDITEAHGWSARVALHCRLVLGAWRQLNV
jgi:hypothetical protein